MAIFLFVKMAAAAILDFKNLQFLMVQGGRLNCINVPNFVELARTAAVI